MDDHKRHVKGYRRAGRVCPCCAEAPKRRAVRMARHRLRAEDRRTIGPAVEEERIDDMIDADYRAIEAEGGLTFSGESIPERYNRMGQAGWFQDAYAGRPLGDGEVSDG